MRTWKGGYEMLHHIYESYVLELFVTFKKATNGFVKVSKKDDCTTLGYLFSDIFDDIMDDFLSGICV